MEAEVITALIGAAGTAATGTFAFFKWWLPFRREKSLNAKTVTGIHSISVLYRCMTSMLGVGVDRVILFAGHNGGGVPSPLGVFYATAIHHVTTHGEDDIISGYSGLVVDGKYCEMLLAARNVEYIRMNTATMEPCKLKRLYEAEGVTDSILYFIGIKKAKCFYLTMANYGGEPPDENQLTRLLIKAEQIARLIRGEQYDPS
jgi:hypothetical protein